MFDLDAALRIPRAVADNFPGGSATVIQAAKAADMQPGAGTFRNLCSAALAYGLIEGGAFAAKITVTPLGKRIVRPVEEGDNTRARREAVLRPRVIREFLQKHDGSPLPRQDIALNVLVDMGVPRERAESGYKLILDSARAVGYIETIKDKPYVQLATEAGPDPTDPSAGSRGAPPSVGSVQEEDDEQPMTSPPVSPRVIATGADPTLARRVFVTHGKNRSFLDLIKKTLGLAEMTPVVSVERQSVSKPVPDKVMDDMWSCGAAVIHVDEELRSVDETGKEHVLVNQDVLIEIGAAMALYGRRYILLVRDGVRLPSNLQGLYEVRYGAETLDGGAAIRLLEAIHELKKTALPPRYLVDRSAAEGEA